MIKKLSLVLLLFAIIFTVASCQKSEKDKLISLYTSTIEYFKSPEYKALFKEPDMEKRNLALEEKQKQLFIDAGFEKPEDVQAIDEKFKDDPDIAKLREEFDKVTQEVTEEMMKEQQIPDINQQLPDSVQEKVNEDLLKDDAPKKEQPEDESNK
ncbi:MAG: hypothetical protein JW917_01455 [Ignavibacteria bacterium]|nr:hypothetical protein [Ignavibacteria bacterium]